VFGACDEQDAVRSGVARVEQEAAVVVGVAVDVVAIGMARGWRTDSGRRTRMRRKVFVVERQVPDVPDLRLEVIARLRLVPLSTRAGVASGGVGEVAVDRDGPGRA
jgi:hypothetical protein